MKKAISFTLVFSFLLALAIQIPVLAEDGSDTAVKATTATTAATTSIEGLTKVPSPNHIPYFEKIKKVGNDLFGVRKASTTETSIKKTSNLEANLAKRIEEAKAKGLEKITSLDQVKLFDKIVKIGNDLFGIRKNNTSAELPTMSTELINCVSAAIDTKDSKVSAILATSTKEISEAITTRGTCQKAALALSSGRQDAIHTCNKAFQEANKKAAEKAKNAQKEIWTAYNDSLKSCSKTANVSPIKIEDGGQGFSDIK